MTIEKAMQLEESNNELATVLLGLVARVTAVRETLKECGHEHIRAAAMLTTFQAEELLQRVSPVFTESMVVQSIQDMADVETQAEASAALKEEMERGPDRCTDPSCVDGWAPRKTGPDDGDVGMEPCPACGGPDAN